MRAQHSLTASHAPPQMSSIVQHAPSAKKIAFGETGRRLGDRFREHLRDVEKMTRTHPNQSPDISISLIILANTRRPAGFPNTKATRKAEKPRTKIHFSNGHTIPTISTNAFHLNTLFLFFTLPCFYQ